MQATALFADVPLAKLSVVDTRIDEAGKAQAVLAGTRGELGLVRVGDVVGLEALPINAIADGCLRFVTDDVTFSLCSEAPEVPRS